MKSVQALHSQAMRLAEKAYLARLRADYALAKGLNEKAFELESAAAKQLLSDYSLEPSRSILARSAATLALDYGNLSGAERLITAALSGEPPPEIAEELRDLLENVYFSRHLSLRGATLYPEEFQFSIWGAFTGAGIAHSEEFLERAQKVESLVYRVAERKLEIPYRDSGRRRKDLKEKVDLYMAQPTAASYAVRFKIGASGQPAFPEMSLGKEIVDELLKGIDLLNASAVDKLRALIPDEAYLNNFIALARDIAPDGERIRGVGFSASRDGKEVEAVLSIPKKQLPASSSTVAPPERVEPVVTVRGVLKFADSLAKRKRPTIKLEEDGGAIHAIEVPPGLMADIVRPRWGQEVEITGVRKRNLILLQSIDPVRDSG